MAFAAAGLLPSLSSAQDCNGLGTPLNNGLHYERTTPNPGGFIVDPGLSVHSDVTKRTGLLAGSSMRLQNESGGGFSGVTTHADCVSGVSVHHPAWGGSGKGFWDTDVGVPVDVVNFPTNWNASQTLSAAACWQKNWTAPGGSTPTGYEFSFNLTFNSATQVDGLYWETLAPRPAGPDPVFQVYVDGVAVGNPVTNFATGDPVSSDTGTSGVFELDYHFGKINQVLSGTHNISVVGVGNDFIMSDFAVMGCCPVPEPSSSLFLALAAFGAISRRKR